LAEKFSLEYRRYFSRGAKREGVSIALSDRNENQKLHIIFQAIAGNPEHRFIAWISKPVHRLETMAEQNGL
jgi:hypothetical protein